jgi:hypothetical protein
MRWRDASCSAWSASGSVGSWRISALGDAGAVRRRCGVSRPTFRKWLRRYEQEGETGLCARSDRPFFGRRPSQAARLGMVPAYENRPCTNPRRQARRHPPLSPCPACRLATCSGQRAGRAVPIQFACPVRSMRSKVRLAAALGPGQMQPIAQRGEQLCPGVYRHVVGRLVHRHVEVEATFARS